MDIIEYRNYCLSLPLVEDSTPFNDDVLVFKIGGKIFAYGSISRFVWVGLKCNPERAIRLREQYEEIGIAPHMSKKHWIGVHVTGGLDDRLVRSLIRCSYNLVVDNMAKSKRSEILAAIEAIEETSPSTLTIDTTYPF